MSIRLGPVNTTIITTSLRDTNSVSNIKKSFILTCCNKAGTAQPIDLVNMAIAVKVRVNDILNKTRAMFDTTDPRELKLALSHFIERVENDGRDATIEYTLKKISTGIGPVNGDPGGLAAVGTFRYQIVLDTNCLTRNTIY
jgi:hypothetical protein